MSELDGRDAHEREAGSERLVREQRDPRDPRDPQDPRDGGTGVGELVRLGALTYARGLLWTAETTAKAGSRIVQAATTGESPAQLAAELGHDVREAARDLLGIREVEEKVDGLASTDGALPGEAQPSPELLRRRGARLLERSADVHDPQDGHPAFARILDELAPDEARILRFFCLEGPQPSIDVRTARPLDLGSQLVEPGINMIGAQAGCRWLDRVPAYLNNLYRLGLVWFSREPLPDQTRYQVLEAQPETIEALKRAGRGKTVRRSIALTPFGQDFCRTCLPVSREGGARGRR